MQHDMRPILKKIPEKRQKKREGHTTSLLDQRNNSYFEVEWSSTTLCTEHWRGQCSWAWTSRNPCTNVADKCLLDLPTLAPPITTAITRLALTLHRRSVRVQPGRKFDHADRMSRGPALVYLMGVEASKQVTTAVEPWPPADEPAAPALETKFQGREGRLRTTATSSSYYCPA